MKYLGSLLLAIAFLFSCSKSKELVPANLEWQVGGDKTEVTQKFNTGSRTNFELKVERISLCPNSNVKITLQSKGVVLYEKEIVDYPYSEKIDVAANSEIELLSKIVDKKGSTDICVWLGVAKCKVSFLQ